MKTTAALNTSPKSTGPTTVPLPGIPSHTDFTLKPVGHNVAKEKKVPEWMWMGEGCGVEPPRFLVTFTMSDCGNDQRVVEKLIQAMVESGLYMSEKAAAKARMGRCIQEGFKRYDSEEFTGDREKYVIWSRRGIWSFDFDGEEQMKLRSANHFHS